MIVELTNVRDSRRARSAFTLIELLIVVAIIAILAAIAVPNFLEAQTRSKIARVAADMRTAATAIESYRIDANAYPPSYWVPPYQPSGHTFPWQITTPVAYISSLSSALDPFKKEGAVFSDGSLRNPETQLYFDYMKAFHQDTDLKNGVIIGEYEGIKPPGGGVVIDDTETWIMLMPDAWFITSFGPNIVEDYTESGAPGYRPYDATNGTLSIGDIYRFGP